MSGLPLPATPAPSLAGLEACGLALARIDAVGRLAWCSTAFRDALGPLDGTQAGLGGRLDAAQCAALWAGRGVDLAGAGSTGWRLQAGAADGGLRWLALQPLAGAATPSDRLQQRLDAIQGFGRIGYFERDAVTGQGWWDAHMYRIWGMPPPDPQAPSPPYDQTAALIHPEDRVPGAYARSLQTAGPHESHIRIRRQDGSWRRVHAQWRVLVDAQGRPQRVVGVHTDDTETYELAQRAAQMGQELEAALAFGQIGTWRQALNQRLWQLDARAARMMGLDPSHDRLRMAPLRRRVHPDDRRLLARAYRVALAGQDPGEATLRFQLPDGSWRHLLTRLVLRRDEGGRAAGFLGVMADVSQLLEQTRRRHETDSRIALAQSALGLGIWHGVAGEDGAWWDRQMFRLRGVDAEPRTVQRAEAVGYLHPDDRHLLQQAHRTLDSAARPEGWRLEYRVVWPDGSVRWLASRSQVVPGKTSGTHDHFGVNWDVTDAHLAAEALRASERAQAESRAKSLLLSRTSHELRTPMNAVLGFTELLLGNPQATPEVRARWLRLIHEAGEHLLVLIDDVLDLARADAGALRVQRQPVDLGALAASTLPLMNAAAQARQVSVAQEGDWAPPALGDPVRLRQVLLNLLSNAIKYNHRGGRVWLRCRRDGAQVELEVADSGPGLDADQQRELFKPFNRLGAEHGSVEGTGIGLAITRSLVESMGGTIAVHSRPGAGCSFRIRLEWARDATPADAGAAEPAAQAPSAPAPTALAPAPHAGKPAPARVLYIEDNRVNAMLVDELLRDQPDLELRIAADGREGLELAASWLPRIALIDIQLPDIDGREVLRRLRADPATRDIVCIALSADAVQLQANPDGVAGFDDFWTKPIRLAGFVGGLRDWLAR